MEDCAEARALEEVLSRSIDCDNTNFGIINHDKSLEYNFETSNSNDSLYKLDSSKTNDETKEQENEENIFDADMGELDTNDFMKGASPLSDNLEFDKIMEQLNDSIEDDIFSSENITDNTTEDASLSNEDLFKENDSNLENIAELNLPNNDIISYINSEDSCSKTNNEDPFLESKAAESNAESNHFPPINDVETQSNEIVDGPVDDISNKEKDIIDLINKELDDTLQFTNVLCHYVYTDVIVGKDFFKLFCSENVKTDLKVVNNAVE